MDITRAHKEFKVFLDNVDTESLPEFQPQEIDIFLHEAELRIVKQAYGRNNVYKQGYQEIQKRTDDLNTLVKTGYLKPRYLNDDDIEIIDGVYSFPLSQIFNTENFLISKSDYMFFVKAMVKVKSATISSTYTDISLIPQDKYTTVIKDPFNKSQIHSPIAFFEDDSIKIDTNKEDFEVEAIRLTYIKYPTKVDKINSINSELPEQKQREALQLAVSIALESVGHPRLQSHVGLTNNQE